MSRVKNIAVRPSQPDPSRRGVHARFVAMAGVLRGLFAAPSLYIWGFESPRIPLNTNDRRTLSKTRRTNRWSLRGARFLRIFVVALRMVVALTAVQFSGVSHAVTDVIAVVQGDHERTHDCPNDEDGRPCPPGCPSCHCTHPMSALPSLGPPFVLDPLTPIEIAIAPHEAQGPPGPEPAALYRPPRTARG